MAGDGGGDGGEAGDEFGEEEGYGAAAGEVALGFGDAGGGFKREAAEEAEDFTAVAAAKEVPHAVRQETGAEDGEEGGDEDDAVCCREGSGGEEHGYAWYGDAKLLDQHPGEEDEVSVPDEKVESDGH